MNIFIWLIFGIIVGVLAHLLDPHPGEGGVRGTILLSLIGAFLGGLAARFFLGLSILGFNLTSVLVSILGAMLVVFVTRGMRKA